MSADWQVGDKAVHVPCAGCGKCLEDDGVVVPGILTVVVVKKFSRECPGLDFSEAPAATYGHWLFCSCQFVKLRPDEHTQCEPEFVQLLQRSKRKVRV